MRARSNRAGDTAEPIRWRLRSLLRARDLTVPQFAAKLRATGYELSVSEIYRLLQHPPQRYDRDLLAAICRTLACDLGDLLQYDPAAGEPELPAPFRVPGT